MLSEKIVTLLTKKTKKFPLTLSDQIVKEYGKDPYLILVSCLLSLRARDVMTIHVCRALFARVRTPKQLLALPLSELEKIIYRSGFYKNKARVLRSVSKMLLEKYGGAVPRDKEVLLSMKGVGIKTANLVLGIAFGVPAICVDTHVHRISNRLGLIKTKTAEHTELALERVVPKRHWIAWNRLLVLWGQHICLPRGPKC